MLFFSVAKDLCLKGAKADISIDGITALHLLSGHESQEASHILEVCVNQAKCNPNAKSIEGLTPVHVASLWGRYRNLEILTTHGGDINETDDEGNNALDFTEDAQCIRLLLELESSGQSHVCANTLQMQNAGLNEQHVCLKTTNDKDSEFTESFYTAIDNESILDHTEVTFPKLHPWNANRSSICGLDETVVDGFRNLSISSYRYNVLNCHIRSWLNYSRISSSSGSCLLRWLLKTDGSLKQLFINNYYCYNHVIKKLPNYR